MSRVIEPVLYIIVPCFNEEESILECADVLNHIKNDMISKNTISSNSKILFVDDGSNDNSWLMIKKLNNEDSSFEGIRLSRNRGHQIALYAGMKSAMRLADAIISIDADLQQDPNAIYSFIEEFKKGFDIVYGVRNNRNSDSFFKKISATLYYKLLKVLKCEIVEQSADYRLLSKRALCALMEYKETNLFIRGIIPTMGFDSSIVYFDVKERKHGKSKYSIKKMVSLALDGVTSFSIQPLRVFLYLGCMISIGSVGIMAYNFFTFVRGINVSGWTSLSMSMLFLGGVELIGIGILGEYIGRIYLESKNRPRFFVQEELISSHDDENLKKMDEGHKNEQS